MPPQQPKTLSDAPRNETLYDVWSIGHILWGAGLAWLIGPVWAFVIMTAWELIENFIISSLYFRATGNVFGRESLKNALSDIAFNLIGIGIGIVITLLFGPGPLT